MGHGLDVYSMFQYLSELLMSDGSRSICIEYREGFFDGLLNVGRVMERHVYKLYEVDESISYKNRYYI